MYTYIEGGHVGMLHISSGVEARRLAERSTSSLLSAPESRARSAVCTRAERSRGSFRVRLPVCVAVREPRDSDYFRVAYCIVFRAVVELVVRNSIIYLPDVKIGWL